MFTNAHTQLTKKEGVQEIYQVEVKSKSLFIVKLIR
jgi:hypothetical protein